MWLIENGNPVPVLRGREKIESFINQCLLGDWVIRIEHRGYEQQPHMGWQQWENSFFAIDNARSVVKSINACHEAFPFHSIRIYAEKFMPEMRMVYCIYESPSAELTPDDSRYLDKRPIDAKQNWPQVSPVSIEEKATGTWRYIAAAGTVAGSVMLWEIASL